MRLILPLFLICLSSFAWSAHGDTTVVRSHNKVDQTWYGNYDRIAKFPEKGKSFQKIIMRYELACPSSGCSDWDYDVNIWLMQNTGKIDTVISKIDTISLTPLVTDTTFQYNKVYNPFEMGRYITPYGSYMDFRNGGYKTAGFDSSWKHAFYYDVTDFAPLLRDSVLIRSQYRGWSSGFQCTVDFIFIEGTPAREVISIQNIYTSGGTYTTPADFEKNRMPGKMCFIPKEARNAQVKVIITGHGADKDNGCGEFCDKNYYFKVNEQSIETVRMWRSDCGLNAVKPQGGTWIFDRANWCPGDKIHPFFHDITSLMTPGDSILLDIDLDPSIATGNNAASYNASAILFVYGHAKHQVDATIRDILSPSTASEYKHWNPICNNPKVILQNLGEKTLTWASISYGVQGGRKREFKWTGTLQYMEQDTITLPTPFWDGVNLESNIFEATVLNANHVYADDNVSNNTCRSEFVPVPRLEAFTLMMRTNGVPAENKLTITNEKGEIAFEMKNLDPNKIYQYDLDLPSGCYELLLTDEGHDGLHFWYYAQTGQNTRTNGWIRLNKKGGGSYMAPNGDFGTEVRYNFVVGTMSIPEANVIRDELKIFPNPAADEIKIQIPQKIAAMGSLDVRITDMSGQLVTEIKNIDANQAYWYDMSVAGISPGIYVVEALLTYTGFEMPGSTEKLRTKIVITH